MKIVFDLDYTLLDTVKFKEALVAATGVDPASYEKAYAKSVENAKGIFDPEKLFNELIDAGLLAEAEASEARGRFDEVLTTTEQYLYPQARELLEALGRHDVEIELMTLGNAKWQQQKVDNSGLAELFDRVIYTEVDKKGVIRSLGADHDKVIVVNDNGKEMVEMMSSAPEYSYVLKRGPKPVPEGLNIPAADTIDELAGILERETGWELRKEMREAREAKEAEEASEASAENDALNDEKTGEAGEADDDTRAAEGRKSEPPEGHSPYGRR